MKIQADARVTFPRETVFATYRDLLPQLVPHLPNITSIEVQSREEAAGGREGVTKILNLWRAEGEIPTVAKALIKPEMVAWDDHATWDQNAWSCSWKVVPRFFEKHIRCEGTNQFLQDGDETIFQLRGDIDIDLKGVKGVPRLLAGRIAPVVERFIVGLLTPNLLKVTDGLQKYLNDQATTA